MNSFQSRASFREAVRRARLTIDDMERLVDAKRVVGPDVIHAHRIAEFDLGGALHVVNALHEAEKVKL